MSESTATARPPTQTTLTPTVRASGKRAAFWIIGALFAVVVGVLTFGLVGSSAGGTPLSPTSAAPDGARAIAEVLKDQGVDVHTPSSLADATAAVDSRAATTVVFHDPDGYLTDEQLAEVATLADRLVVIDPDFAALNALAPGIAAAGAVDGVLEADCSIGAVRNAISVTGDGFGYRILDAPAATGCLGSGDDIYSLIELPSSGTTVTVLGTTTALTNERVALEGNAALALTLFGATDTLVWYQPTAEDLTEQNVSPEQLLPRWTVGIGLAVLLTGIAAAIWRGRRFGPLVIENLPVTVPASETTEGRARLYERNNARLRALDSLRIGTLQRLGRQVGLSRTATVDEIVDAVASVTGSPVPAIRALLVDADPHSDAELVRLSDELLTLERAVSAATNPTPETGRTHG
ncbi:DUF4350 domain-containing protein [Diaminobutyricimonas sp. TR449]|uniref:DUF4350 domain-containing protein n=1 Tax=Diaminobutyricimonas sp. TR449 TaxID=2708076 RepID=UPI00142354E0|nr:DUF4350 domain-containing protein [Diaminobutyricimonas sp. TR449]